MCVCECVCACVYVCMWVHNICMHILRKRTTLCIYQLLSLFISSQPTVILELILDTWCSREKDFCAIKLELSDYVTNCDYELMAAITTIMSVSAKLFYKYAYSTIHNQDMLPACMFWVCTRKIATVCPSNKKILSQ